MITASKKGKLNFHDNNPHLAELPKKEKALVINTIHSWAKRKAHPDFYDIIDVVHRIAGCSSLGMKRYVVLVEGNDEAGNYLLDIKETNQSCLREFIKTKQPAWKSEAERLIEVQQRILSGPPALLSPIDIGTSNFVLKELQPIADRIDYNVFKGKLKKLKAIIENMAAIYAWGNLRSSGRQGSAKADDLIAFAQNTGKVKKELIHCASSYTKVVNAYHTSYCSAYDKGFFKV
jgi:uncharacterized protein (DUF2252 family)